MNGLARVARIVGGVALTLALSEVGVRVAHIAPNVERLAPDAAESSYETDPDPELLYHLKRSFRSDHPDHYETFAETNSDGQRDVERTRARVPGRARILLVGDSVVAGHHLHDLHQTLSWQMESNPPHGHPEVLNFGVGGYSLPNEVALIEKKGILYSPDVVVLVFVDNDYNQVEAHTMRQKHAWGDELFLDSSLFRFVALQTNLLGYRTMFVGQVSVPWGVGDNQRMMARLAEGPKKNPFQLLVVAWPRFDRDAIRTVGPLEATWGAEPSFLEGECADVGIRCLRLEPYFQADLAARRAAGETRTPTELYSVGDTEHPSPLGATVGAAAIWDALARAGITLPTPDAPPTEDAPPTGNAPPPAADPG